MTIDSRTLYTTLLGLKAPWEITDVEMKQRCGLAVSVWTVGRYLRHCELTPQKPLPRAYEQNPEAVERCLGEEYPAIRARAKRECAQILWGDELGLRSDHQAGRSYGRRGQTPVIPGTRQRFRGNVISTLSNRGDQAFIAFRENFTVPELLRFLRRLLRHGGGRKVFLIVDRRPVHRARAVTRWLAARADQIALFVWPGERPELNPDELLNQDVKPNALARRRPGDLAERMGDARAYVRSTQKQPALMRRNFQQRHVRHVAA